MDKVKTYPIYKKFTFQVFIFMVLLFISISSPLWVISKGNYKDIMDRCTVQRGLLFAIIDSLSDTRIEDLSKHTDLIPEILQNQRVILLSLDKDLIFDSGIMSEVEFNNTYDLKLPHPYKTNIDKRGSKPKDIFRAIGKLNYLQRIAIINVQSNKGMDRVILSGKIIKMHNDKEYLLLLCSSAVDILIQNRAIKERFLFVYITVLFLAILLTIILSRSVISPFTKLYKFSYNLLNRHEVDISPLKFNFTGELGAICKAISELIISQKKMADNFKGFSSDVVHELKTPLSTIRSGLELYVESSDDEEKSHIHRMISKRIQNMENLMNDINDLGKLEFVTQDYKVSSEVDLKLLLDEISDNYSKYSINVNIYNNLDIMNIPLSINKLRQIFENLISNAISFSPEQGSVSIGVFTQGRNIYISIKDSGPGVSGDIIDNITERFYSFRPFNNGDKHSGLGLSIIKAILNSCKGSLKIENDKNHGAIFTVEIPLVNS